MMTPSPHRAAGATLQPPTPPRRASCAPEPSAGLVPRREPRPHRRKPRRGPDTQSAGRAPARSSDGGRTEPEGRRRRRRTEGSVPGPRSRPVPAALRVRGPAGPAPAPRLLRKPRAPARPAPTHRRRARSRNAGTDRTPRRSWWPRGRERAWAARAPLRGCRSAAPGGTPDATGWQRLGRGRFSHSALDAQLTGRRAWALPARPRPGSDAPTPVPAPAPRPASVSSPGSVQPLTLAGNRAFPSARGAAPTRELSAAHGY